MYIHVYIHVYMYQLFMLQKQCAQIQLLLNHSYSWEGGGVFVDCQNLLVRGEGNSWVTGLLHYYF